MKAVVTTFPLDYYQVCAREMLETFDKFWPADIELFIQLDRVPQEQYDKLNNELNTLLASGRQYYLCNDWSREQIDFNDRHKDDVNASYRFQVCKFSHKVFALLGASNHCKQVGHTHLIWLDADVITKAPITHEDLDELLPLPDQAVSYLGRKNAPHSECGFVGYNLHNVSVGHDIIQDMADYYINNTVFSLSGWTDCDVFDAAIEGYKKKNLSQDVPGWHVFPISPLGKYMEHRKGQRKYTAEHVVKKVKNDVRKDKDVAIDSLQIKTRNCLPNEKIQENIRENLSLIRKWAHHVAPHDEEIVICSAGDSLSYADIKPWADKGVKIVTVKHAIDRLKDWGIKPWACVLLDPRPHVEGFVQTPDKDVIYFVASMVDPSVTKSLLKAGCRVVGYHALVGAGEEKLLNHKELIVSGGSATATRSIGLLHECLGFKTFHMYGYDLCYYERPDHKVKNEDGQQKYIEVTLTAQGYGGRTYKRTFWTEGQFLAQAQELRDLYKGNHGFTMKLYGHGIAAWQQELFLQYRAWSEQYMAELNGLRTNGISLADWERIV